MIVDPPMCACGYPMTKAHNDNYFICVNCDLPQAIELAIVDIKDGVAINGKRVRTERDQKFDATWEARKILYYGE